ncbi:M61 family peptidase, partial [Sphingomonas sp. S-NIH.Pt15_0812]
MLTVSYHVVSAYDHDPTVDDSEQPRPVIRPTWFYAVGNALFGYPAGREDAPATFDWSSAPGIGFASDLEHLAG